MRHRRSDEENESFFCRFTFGQFFALLVLEVFTLFFVFYLGARYGREFLGLDRNAEVAQEEVAPKVPTTDDPEVAAMARDLIRQAKTPELKDRIAKMLDNEQKTPPASEKAQPAPTPPPPAAEQSAQPAAAPAAEPSPSPEPQ